MERESNQMQTLCRSGCGFYGSPATDGLCSLCYKEALKKKQQLPTTPSSHCNALSMASAATPTTNHISPLVSHADFGQAESMSQSHLPSKKSSQELPNRPSNTLLPGAAAQNRPGDQQQQGSGRDVSATSLHPGMERRVSAEGMVVLDGAVDQSQAAATSTPEPISVPLEASPSSVPGVSTESADEDKDGDKDKKKKNRCRVCRKKLGLTGFECRCGGLFCGIHRYSDKHDCDFDYRELGAKEIRRNNPVVVGEKIQKI